MGASFLGMVSCQQGPDTLIRKNPGALGYGGIRCPPEGSEPSALLGQNPRDLSPA